MTARRLAMGGCKRAHVIVLDGFRAAVFSIALVVCIAAPSAGALPPPPPGVEVTIQHGIEFSTIGSPGNAPYPGNPFVTGAGWGSVSRTYSLSRTEITNAQWLPF